MPTPLVGLRRMKPAQRQGLAQVGLDSMEKLADATLPQIMQAAQVTELRADEWRTSARTVVRAQAARTRQQVEQLEAVLQPTVEQQPLPVVNRTPLAPLPGLGQGRLQRLATQGITTAEQFVTADSEQIAQNLRVSVGQVQTWQQTAQASLATSAPAASLPTTNANLLPTAPIPTNPVSTMPVMPTPTVNPIPVPTAPATYTPTMPVAPTTATNTNQPPVTSIPVNAKPVPAAYTLAAPASINPTSPRPVTPMPTATPVPTAPTAANPTSPRPVTPMPTATPVPTVPAAYIPTDPVAAKPITPPIPSAPKPKPSAEETPPDVPLNFDEPPPEDEDRSPW
jgi:hypothetical protein